MLGETGSLHVEVRVDEATIWFSQEAERWARALREGEARLGAKESKLPAQGYEVRLPDPVGGGESRGVLQVSPEQVRLERELDRARRELSRQSPSPRGTDTVRAEVAG